MRATAGRTERRDDGAALITVIMILGLVGALSLTLAVVTTNNLVSARLAQQAGAAVNASDAGVSQAVTYLRENGVGGINPCWTWDSASGRYVWHSSPACTTTPWTNEANPAVVTVGGRADQSYRVWIKPIAKFPENRPGVYRITSTGVAGGPAGRTVTVDVAIDLVKYPLGIAANATLGGGEVTANNISVFSTGCVYRRERITFTGIDKAYGIPAAAHSAGTITNSQGSGRDCPGTNKPIHDPTKPAPQPACNTVFPYDQDKDGGPLGTTYCADRAADDPAFSSYPQFSDASHPAYQYPQTSKMTEADLFAKFGVRRPPLTQSQLAYLKSMAVAQGNFWTSATGWTVPAAKHAVVYFDLTAAASTDRKVNLTHFTPSGTTSAWYRPPGQSSGCSDRSLVILIEGGDATFPAGDTHAMAGSLFLLSENPYGNLSKANGASRFTGTIYANNLDFTGEASVALDDCFLATLPPALTTVTTFNYREVDR